MSSNAYLILVRWPCLPRIRFTTAALTTASTAIKLEGIYATKNSIVLWDFSDPESVKACSDMSDSDIGGYSEAHLDYVPKSAYQPAHARFYGSISNKLPANDALVERTGYAAWRTEDRPRTVFGKALWDIDPYTFLALRIRSDGRKYKVNVQTESLIYTDLHQHRLYARHPGSWETILIKWNEFVRTNHGMVVEPQSEMMREKVRTLGIGLTDRFAGPFEMCISKIWATNGLTADELEASGHSDSTYVPKDVKASIDSAGVQTSTRNQRQAL